MPSIEIDGGDDCAERCKEGCSLLTDSTGRCVRNCVTKLGLQIQNFATFSQRFYGTGALRYFKILV